MEGEHEQHASIRGGWHQKPKVLRAEVLLQHDVGPTAGEHPWGGISLRHLPDLISANARGIDKRRGAPTFPLARGGFTDGGLELARAIGFQLHHPATGAQGCPPLLRSESQQQVQACIVELPIAVGHSALTLLQQR